MIFLISASQVARIIDVSHQYPAGLELLILLPLPLKLLGLQPYVTVPSYKFFEKQHLAMLELECPTLGGCWWLTPVILATQKAEVRRIRVQSHSRQIIFETLS
jgi:hypothetical protein